MRELKFRAWTGKKFIGPVTFPFPTGYSGNLDFRMLSTYDWSQYTGLKDKNGKEIYEGDIVVTPLRTQTFRGWKPNGLNKREVKWYSTAVFTGFNIAPKSAKKCEVIGNIYENGDLLK